MTDLLFVDFQARIPTVKEDQMLNYVMIMALEVDIQQKEEGEYKKWVI